MIRVFIVSGIKNSGKTNLCKKLVKDLRENGVVIKGIISPGIYAGDKKTEISAVDLSNNEKVILAENCPGWDKKKPMCEWNFKKEAIPWGKEVLSHSVPCDILLVDEIGFLEFEENDGWSNVFQIISEKQFTSAVVVVRISLLDHALARWPKAKVLEVKESGDIDPLEKSLCFQLLNNLRS